MSTERKRSTSPFPSAYKVITDHENDKKKTVRVGPTVELLQGCRELNGVKCKNCDTWDETGVDWHIVIFMEEDATPKYSWYCKLCFKSEDHLKSDYVYSGRHLKNSIEVMSSKKSRPK